MFSNGMGLRSEDSQESADVMFDLDFASLHHSVPLNKTQDTTFLSLLKRCNRVCSFFLVFL